MADPPQTFTWENALTAFAAKSQSGGVVDRHTVADATKPWIAHHYAGTSPNMSTADVYAYWTDSNSQVVQYVTGTLDWGQWDVKDHSSVTPLEHFTGSPGDILYQLLGSARDLTDATTSRASFPAAKKLISDITTWLTDQMKAVDDWIKDIDVSDSDLQGSAAGRFKQVMMGFHAELAQIQIQIQGTLTAPTKDPKKTNNPTSTDLASALDEAGAQLTRTLSALLAGFQDWWGGTGGSGAWVEKTEGNWVINEPSSSMAMPAIAAQAAFQEAIVKVTVTVAGTYNTVTMTGPNGTPNDEGWWTAVNLVGYQKWMDYVALKLDTAAGPAMADLGVYYDRVLAFMTPYFKQPTLTPPKDPNSTAPPGGTNGPNTNGPNTGGGPPPPKTSTAPPPKVGGAPPPKVNLGGPSGTGGGSGSSAPLLGKDGKPLLGKDGKPLVVPPGSTVNAKGEVIGPDGKPVLGKDGKPLMVPPGTTVGKPTTTTGPTTPGISGAFRVPAGSKRNADGTVTGPDGKKVVDSNGNPVVLAEGDTINADGAVMDANGKPVSTLNQLLSDEEHAYAAGPGSTLVTGGGGYTGRTITVGGIGGTSLGGSSFGESPGGLGGGSVSGGSAKTLTPTVGIGGRMAEQYGSTLGQTPGLETAMAGLPEGALATAAEQAQLTGGSTATTGGGGGSMMPPMGGMGGGMGGGAGGQGGQERQRTTWLAEDEEVWGTESGAVSGVIGR